MSIADLRVLPLLLASAAVPAQAAAPTTRATLRFAASRTGAVIDVDGRLRPAGAGRRFVVLVRKAGATLGRVAQPLHRDGTFSARLVLAHDPGPIRVTVLAGRLRASRPLP